MRITVTLDGDLVKQASVLTGITEMSVLLRESLQALIDRELPEAPATEPAEGDGEDLPEGE
ncbi:type II toxin-antitoxin system VapB family antitoxin [Georgenia sp. AZ-5]|uniref:type II toxin-antitoxin system VapB family antitoxin n=1 Tax=Georgenia sp. AZ-5 TaxID=3367526 RepID=UPI0037551318